MDTVKAHVNVDHKARERWGLPIVNFDWPAFVSRCIKASKEKTGKQCMIRTEMSRAVGVKKPQEAQEARALWKKGRQPRMQEKNTATPRVRKASKEETRPLL